jgi:hypothetical protein
MALGGALVNRSGKLIVEDILVQVAHGDFSYFQKLIITELLAGPRTEPLSIPRGGFFQVYLQENFRRIE